MAGLPFAAVVAVAPCSDRIQLRAGESRCSPAVTRYELHIGVVVGMQYGSRVDGAPLRVMLDSNGFDALALDDHVRAVVESAVEAGALDLVVTHVQMDEVGNTPDPKRAALLRLTVSATYTSGIVLGLSRLGMAAFSTPEEDVIFDAVIGGNPRHNEDALILLTARRERIPIVTNDELLTKRCATHGVEVMKPADLMALLSE